MSNQVGDRYVCSDSNCGCEIEITSPCTKEGSARRTDDNLREGLQARGSIGAGSTREGSMSAGSTGAGTRSAGRAQSVSPEAGQRIGAEGTGATDLPGTSTSRETGYATPDEASTVHLDSREASASSNPEGTESVIFVMTCFCGSPMLEEESSAGRSRAASA